MMKISLRHDRLKTTVNDYVSKNVFKVINDAPCNTNPYGYNFKNQIRPFFDSCEMQFHRFYISN
jgi:hypothetical protein